MPSSLNTVVYRGRYHSGIVRLEVFSSRVSLVLWTSRWVLSFYVTVNEAKRAITVAVMTSASHILYLISGRETKLDSPKSGRLQPKRENSDFEIIGYLSQ